MTEQTAEASKRSLGDFFSFADFLLFWNDRSRAEDASPREEADYVKRYSTLREEILQPAIAAFLKAKNARGELASIEGSEGHSTRLLDAWNGVATNALRGEAARRAWGIIARCFDHRLVFNATYQDGAGMVSRGQRPPSGPRQAYDMMIAIADKGDFAWWRDIQDREQCRSTGMRFAYDIKDWKITFGTSGSGMDLDPMQSVAKPKVRCLGAEIEGGEWLVADWFRIPGFSEAFEEQDDEDISCVAGLEARTRRYLEKHGIVHVFVSNTSPDIVAREGAVIIGGLREGMEDQAVGSISTALWWVTALPREKLVSIIAETAGREQAEVLVEAYVREPTNCVTGLNMAEGRWYLHFSGDEAVMKGFKPKGFAMAGVTRPNLVLADRPLMPNPEELTPREMASEVPGMGR